MAADITQYESLRKAEFSYHGMVRRCALRNIAAMEPNGLKAARKRLKVGQAVIAERLGVSVPQVAMGKRHRQCAQRAAYGFR